MTTNEDFNFNADRFYSNLAYMEHDPFDLLKDEFSYQQDLSSNQSHVGFSTKSVKSSDIISSSINMNSDSYSSSNRKGKWTEEEDRKLIDLVEEFNGRSWKRIAKEMNSRTPIQCLHRWSKILKPGLVKGSWTTDEDNSLIAYVRKFGSKDFHNVSNYINGRTAKQCRERWYNVLNPKILKGGWTINEDYMIFRLYSLFGGKWIKFTKYFCGLRSENSLKNRFYSTIRRFNTILKKKNINIDSDQQKIQTLYDEIFENFKNQNRLCSEEDVANFELKHFGFNGHLEESTQSKYESSHRSSNLNFNLNNCYEKLMQKEMNSYTKAATQERSSDLLSNHSLAQPTQSVSNNYSFPINNNSLTININGNVRPELKRNLVYSNGNDIKSNNLKNLEKDISNFCKNPDFVFDDPYFNRTSNEIDMWLDSLLDKNSNDTMKNSSTAQSAIDLCNFENETACSKEGTEDKATGIKVDEMKSLIKNFDKTPRKKDFQSLITQLDDLENLVKETRSQLIMLEKDKIEET